jgi:hypothetical protein
MEDAAAVNIHTWHKYDRSLIVCANVALATITTVFAHNYTIHTFSQSIPCLTDAVSTSPSSQLLLASCYVNKSQGAQNQCLLSTC